MRIAIEASWACGDATGIGLYVRGLLGGLAQLDTDDEFLLMHWCRDWTGGQYDERFQPTGYRFGPATTSILFALNRKMSSIGGIDLFHATAATGIPPQLSLPAIATIHDLFRLEPDFPGSRWEKLKFRRMLRWSLRRASHLICNSSFTAGELRQSAYYRGQQITVTHLAPACIPDKITPGTADSKPYLLCLGGIERRKGQLFLVDVYAALKRMVAEPPRLLFVGPDRGQGGQLQQRIRDLSLESAVEWRGYVSEREKQELLARATVFIMPSRQEGFGLPALEAMAASVPTVVAGIPVIKEIVGNGALVVDGWAVEEWSRQLAHLLNNRDTRQMLAVKGRREAEKYSWRTCAAETMAVYRKVANMG